MNRRTKALAIPPEVKATVRERDMGCCVLCGSPYGEPNAHYLSRARGGLGVEKNVVTLCRQCHMRYDQSPEREEIRKDLREYLMSKYPDWNEKDLVYKKGDMNGD